MARVAATEATRHGVYAFLEQLEEAGFRRWLRAEEQRRRNGYGARRYLRQRRLDALGSGRPVNVSAGDLPGWARSTGPVVAGSFARVVVSGDDLVTAAEADVALWLEEMDL